MSKEIIDKLEKEEKDRYEREGIIFVAQCDTTWEGKSFRQGDILPWEARNCSASIQVKQIGKNDFKIEKSDLSTNEKDVLKILKENRRKEEKPEPKEKIKKDKEFAIEDLPGVGATTAEKLRESGYDNLMSIATSSPAELVELTGVGENVAKRIIQVARTKLDIGFETGEDILKKAEKIERIKTGSEELNRLLGGGAETGTITEFYAPYASGKSQVGFQLAVNVQLPKEKGGLDGVAVIIDTESTFRAQRIKQLAESAGLDYTKVLRNIKIIRALNSDHQMLIAEKVEDLIKKDNLPVRLLIIDSLMSLFRSEYGGRSQLADRQQKLNKHIHVLQKLADTYNIVVYVTNQVMARPDVFFGDPTEPIGGHIVGHGMNPRVYLRKGKKGTRVARLVDSSYLPEAEVIFKITEKGIEDV